METLLHTDEGCSGSTPNTTRVPAEKVHKILSDRWITLKFLEFL